MTTDSTSGDHSISHLHDAVHGFVTRSHDGPGWWLAPLETGLAAASISSHPDIYRRPAEEGLAALEAWWRDGEPRTTSEDAAALALAARAAAALSKRNPALTKAAAESLVEVLDSPAQVPALHLALTAWALDELISDRSQHPWPQIRQRTASSSGDGTERALLHLAEGIAADPFDPTTFLAKALESASPAIGLADAPVLLWCLWTTATRAAAVMNSDDAALVYLAQRRTELLDLLAAEIDSTSFVAPPIDEFDPLGEPIDLDRPHFGLIQALMLDLTLAPYVGRDALYTKREAELLGDEGRRAERRITARYLSAGAAVIAVLGGVIAGLAGLDSWRAGATAVAAGAAVAVIALRFWRSGAPTSRVPWDACIDLAAWTVFAALVFIGNRSLTHPVIGDLGAALVALIAVPVMTVVSQVIRR